MGSAFTPGGNTQGVIPKVMFSIFQRINSNKDAEYTVRVGFVEIHKVLQWFALLVVHAIHAVHEPCCLLAMYSMLLANVLHLQSCMCS